MDALGGEVLYSRGFASIYGEWETTGEARRRNRTFHESLRFPAPEAPVRIRLKKRDDVNSFGTIWTVDIDPDDLLVVRQPAPAAAPLIEIQSNGDPAQKVDLLILGDGYTAEEAEKFRADTERLVDGFFQVEPFKSRRQDFNVWAIMPPSPESGVSRPSNGNYRWSPLGTRYDAFRSERYVLTFDNQAFRNIAAHAPYDAVEILVNNETYGGGGIFNLYSTAAAGSDWSTYLFVHEFGHHFAALADEYYTSPVAYESNDTRPEPWEPNVTALQNPARLKWQHLVEHSTPLPTPWPKQQYDEHALEYQARRVELRKEDAPEAQMNALFRENQNFISELFGQSEHKDTVGAFEGANYQSTGYYRPAMDCLMFTRSDHFCPVCSEAIEEIIDLYTGDSP